MKVTVAVDTNLTPELIQEGYARDLVRAINTMRKEAGLALDDRISLYFEAQGDVAEAMTNFANYIQQETLAVTLTAGDLDAGKHQRTISIDDSRVTLSLRLN